MQPDELPCVATPKLSVVIPCFNAAETLQVQLDALARQTTAPWEVIVADNGSTDKSRATAEAYVDRLPRLQVIDAGRRRGASFARNAAASIASGEFVAFCDADDEVDAGWVAGLLVALARNDFVASRFETRKLSSRESSYVHPQESGLQDAYGFLPHAGGCGLAIRLTLHRQIGGFDERVRYLEDTDYCWQQQLAGTSLTFAEGAMVHVRPRASASEDFSRAWRWAACEVQLYRRYRKFGFPKPDRRAAIREWRRVARMLFRVAFRGRPAGSALAWSLGKRVGRLVGCLTYFRSYVPSLAAPEARTSEDQRAMQARQMPNSNRS